MTAKPRADWRLLDYTGHIRAELRNVDVRTAAPVFQLLITRTAMTGAAIPHPQVAARRKAERWRKLNMDEMRRFWTHTTPPMDELL